MITQFIAGGVVINNDKVVLVYQIKSNTWSLPKGKIENGETPLEAAKREIYEEAGITQLEFVKELGSYSRGTQNNSGIKKQIIIFLFKTNQTKLNPHDSNNPEARWVPREEVSQILSYPEDKNFFVSIKKDT